MAIHLDNFRTRAEQYANAKGLVLSAETLGSGQDGVVFGTSRQSAIKVFVTISGYNNEKRVYLRLSQRAIDEICGHSVSQLRGYDDRLLAIEMSVIEPPYVLEFAKSTIDEELDLLSE